MFIEQPLLKLSAKGRTPAVERWDVTDFEQFWMTISIFKIFSSDLLRSFVQEFCCFIPIFQPDKLKGGECWDCCTFSLSTAHQWQHSHEFVQVLLLGCRSKVRQWLTLDKINCHTSRFQPSWLRKFGPLVQSVCSVYSSFASFLKYEIIQSLCLQTPGHSCYLSSPLFSMCSTGFSLLKTGKLPFKIESLSLKCFMHEKYNGLWYASSQARWSKGTFWP